MLLVLLFDRSPHSRAMAQHRPAPGPGTVAPVAAVPPAAAHGRLEQIHFYSRALGQPRLFLVYLPPGYAADAAKGMRFPVLYLLHGNPGWPGQFIRYASLEQDVSALVDEHAISPFLVVMPDGRTSQGVHSDTEWANTTAGGPFETVVLETVKAVDSRFPTVANRAGRALAGNSSGAFGAINDGLHNLNVFGTLESWSGYFREFPGAPFTHGPPGVLRANSPAIYLGSLRAQLRRFPLRVWLYSGTKDDTRSVLLPFAARLRAEGVQVRAEIDPGPHEWSLWRRQMPRALEYASRSFATSEKPSGPGSSPPAPGPPRCAAAGCTLPLDQFATARPS